VVQIHLPLLFVASRARSEATSTASDDGRTELI
jgi:hypothetical protein